MGKFTLIMNRSASKGDSVNPVCYIEGAHFFKIIRRDISHKYIISHIVKFVNKLEVLSDIRYTYR